MDNMDFDPSVDATASASVIARDGDYVGVNKIVADMVVDLTGGDLFNIQTVHKYPSGYRATTNMASEEKSDNARPELATSLENMEDYDVIILISPNWWATIPMPLFTFLEAYDFSGKTIAPLCTHEGSGLGSSLSDIRTLATGATVLDGLAIRGSSVTSAQGQIENWVNGLNISN
jgi:flavodoxin